MDDSPKNWAEKVLELPPIYFYSALGLIGAAIFLWSQSGEAKPQSEPVAEYAASNLLDRPDPPSSSDSPLELLKSKLSPAALVDTEMTTVFKNFESLLKRGNSSDQESVAPGWLSASFKATGIDYERMGERFNDQQVSVKRWRTSDNDPKFEGTEGFYELINNLTSQFEGKRDFRVSLKAYSSEVDSQDQLKIRLVAELNGNEEQTFVEQSKSGFTQKANQSTSLWETIWERNPNRDSTHPYLLCDFKALAEEHVVASMNSRELMADCTASILGQTDAADQFRYGLDQWSRKIPGIDLNGDQGIAIGDANGDGMDDLYVCQTHGLPNRLLIQNSDGTVTDSSEKSHTGILDQSRSALFLDIDNDGDQDLIVATDETLAIMSNDGLGVYQLERKIAVGRNAQSITASDFDNDGDLDLFLCKYGDINRQSDLLMFPTDLEKASDGGRNVLLRNDEGFEFVDVTDQVGLQVNNSRYTRAAIWFDYDQDGDQDLYVTNEFASDQMFENQDGYFTDKAQAMGMDEVARHKSVSLADFNQDGYEDLFVATDVPLAGYRVLQGLKNSPSLPGSKKSELDDSFELRKSVQHQMLSESQIRYNTGEAGFQPFFLRAPIFNGQTANGTAAADLNNDGMDDLIVTNGGVTRIDERDLTELFYSQAFAPASDFPWASDAPIQTPGPGPTPSTQAYQIARTSHEIADLCRSGFSLNASQRNRCYLNIGTGFANISGLTGLDLPDDARAVSVVDWDNDGDLDVVTTCRSAPQLRIFCNQLNASNTSVTFSLKGTRSNRDAIGTRVELKVSGRPNPIVKTLQAGSGNLSQSSKRVLFGIPRQSKIESVTFYWPSGAVQTFDQVSEGANYDVVEGEQAMAETVNDRFALNIRPNSLVPRIAIPAPKTRSLFYPKAPMTQLQVQVEPDKWLNLRADQGPMLVLFWSRDAESDEWIRKLDRELLDTVSSDSESKDATNSTPLEVISILVDRSASDSEQWLYAKERVEDSEYRGKWGTLAPSSIQKLELMFGEWFNHRQLSMLPCALLIDKDQRVCAHYTLGSFDTEQVLADLHLIQQPDLQYRLASHEGGGIWVADSREIKVNRLRVRFKEFGFEETAQELDKAAAKQRAHEMTAKGVELGAQLDYAKALSFFRQAIMVDPTCFEAHLGEAQLLMRAARDVPNDDPQKYQMQVRSTQEFDIALELNPVSIEAIIGRAQIALDQGQRSTALKQLEDFLEFAPDRYEVHAVVGRLLFQEKRYEEAAQHLVQAFDQRPNLPYLAGDLGYLYLVSGEDKYARKFLRLANRLQPSDRNILRLLAEAEFVTGNFDEAVRLFTEVNRLDPSRRRSKNVLAWLLATCPYENHRDGEAAIKIISPMVELFGDSSPSTLEIYAACFAENGDFEKAIEFQEKAVQILEESKATEAYSEEQRKGMVARLELYRRKRPYRTADILQIPIARPQRLD